MGNMFTGTGVALVTPFDDNLQVDYESLAQLIKHVSDGGVDYLVVMGTTGEAPTISASEKSKILDCVQQHNEKKLPIVFGMGGNNTSQLVEQYQSFEGEVDAFLVVTPYYNRPNQNGLIAHYTAVADVAENPLILYNVPKRTGVNMEAATVIELSKHSNIIGVKEASAGNFDQLKNILAGVPNDFSVISGDDDLIVPFMEIGGHGVISVIGNALPNLTSSLVRSMLQNDMKSAKLAEKEMNELLGLIFQEGSPAGIKSLLATFGIGNGKLRLPMLEASKALQQQIESAAQKHSTE